jgi:hypothetical protein
LNIIGFFGAIEWYYSFLIHKIIILLNAVRKDSTVQQYRCFMFLVTFYYIKSKELNVHTCSFAIYYFKILLTLSSYEWHLMKVHVKYLCKISLYFSGHWNDIYWNNSVHHSSTHHIYFNSLYATLYIKIYVFWRTLHVLATSQPSSGVIYLLFMTPYILNGCAKRSSSTFMIYMYHNNKLNKKLIKMTR